MSALCVGMGLGGALDLEAASAANQDYMNTRTSERQEMITLNDRLAVYIEKVRRVRVRTLHLFFPGCAPESINEYVYLQVRTLEQQNTLLETEIEALKGRYVKPSGLRMMYEEQLRELRRVADQMRVQRVRSERKQKKKHVLSQ